MSNLLVQNIKHTNNTTSMAIDTSGQVTIRGEGSATTTNLQQGLAKVWFHFDGSGTASISDSFNVSSLDDDGTGQYGLHYTNNLATANQGAGHNASFGNASATAHFLDYHTTTTSTVDMDGFKISTGGSLAQNDIQAARGNIFGDLA